MRVVLISLVFISFCGLLHTHGRGFSSCPPLQDDVAGICVEDCSSDNDCQSSEEKCCSNGCGHTCTRAVTIPHYDPPTNTAGSPVCQLLLNQIARNTSLIGAYLPQCNSDGSFSPVQCHPSTGYCWCVHIQTGEPVSGVVRFGQPECANCSYQGEVYNIGQSFPASSSPANCNQCTCMAEGNVICTQMPVPCPLTTTPPPPPPPPGVERFYSCPVLPNDAVGICVDECERDSDCSGNWKCCDNNCGHTCRNPVTIPYVPPPPLGDGSCQDILDRQDQSPPMLGAYVPQCDDDGRFQSLQCHSDRFCWCVNPYTGRPTSDLTSQDDLDGLNCSDCTYDGERFADGEDFESIDGCNTCFCDGGMVACTEAFCIGDDDSTPLWWQLVLMVGGVVAIILTIIAVFMVVVVVVLMRRNKFHHHRMKNTTSFATFQDADLDFKDGVEAIELKVPVENLDPVKT